MYSYEFAVGVVHKFCYKYARAPEIVAKMFGLPPEMARDFMINLFRIDNSGWNRVRDAVKRCEKRSAVVIMPSDLGIETAVLNKCSHGQFRT